MPDDPTPPDAAELARFEARVDALLPPRYQHCGGAVRTASMGSAGVRFGPDGRPDWGRIWTTYCDLALAGGPPHRGTWLESLPADEVAADPAAAHAVAEEIGRAVGLTTGLAVGPGGDPGRVGVDCGSAAAAAWLRAAVVAENVSAGRRGAVLDLPAGPRFRVEKEIKNVVVALAKAYHYWDGHLTPAQQTAAPADDWCEPATPADAATEAFRRARADLEAAVHAAGGRAAPDRAAGWVGVDCGDEAAAAWLVRGVAAERVLVRREAAVLCLPVGAGVPRVAEAFAGAWRLWPARLASGVVPG